MREISRWHDTLPRLVCRYQAKASDKDDKAGTMLLFFLVQVAFEIVLHSPNPL